MPLRFDVDYGDPGIAWDPLVDEVFGELTSGFLEMPKGEGFVDYPTFERGYRELRPRPRRRPHRSPAPPREVDYCFKC